MFNITEEDVLAVCEQLKDKYPLDVFVIGPVMGIVIGIIIALLVKSGIWPK